MARGEGRYVPVELVGTLAMGVDQHAREHRSACTKQDEGVEVVSSEGPRLPWRHEGAGERGDEGGGQEGGQHRAPLGLRLRVAQALGHLV